MFAISSAVLLSTLVAAAPSPPIAAREASGAVHVPLKHHVSRQYSSDLAIRQDWLLEQANGIRSKYMKEMDSDQQAKVKRDIAERRSKKRDTGNTNLVNIGIDASYSGEVDVG